VDVANFWVVGVANFFLGLTNFWSLIDWTDRYWRDQYIRAWKTFFGSIYRYWWEQYIYVMGVRVGVDGGIDENITFQRYWWEQYISVMSLRTCQHHFSIKSAILCLKCAEWYCMVSDWRVLDYSIPSFTIAVKGKICKNIPKSVVTSLFFNYSNFC